MRNFALIDNAGSGFTGTNFNVVLPTTGGTNCSQSATLNVTQSGGALVSINSIVAPAICQEYPNTSNPVTVTAGGGTATLWVAYFPTPMSEWIRSVNNANSYPTGAGQLTNYIKAYTKESAPVALASVTDDIPNLADWGSPYWNKVFNKVPPTQDPSNPNRWTIVLTHYTTDLAFPPYFATTDNFVCMHTDSGTAWQVSDVLNQAPGGTDVVFDDVVWVNAARGVFHGVTGAQILNGSIARDTTTFSGGQLPCYSSNSGGPQFSQPNETVTYGNTIYNFTATATSDDSLAIFNDVGGKANPSGGVYPITTVSSSTITSADGHPIRLYNNSTITNIIDASDPTLLDSYNCPTNTGTGSRVCVDSATQNVISSTPANCDTYLWNTASSGNGCPLYLDYYGYAGKTHYFIDVQ